MSLNDESWRSGIDLFLCLYIARPVPYSFPFFPLILYHHYYTAFMQSTWVETIIYLECPGVFLSVKYCSAPESTRWLESRLK